MDTQTSSNPVSKFISVFRYSSVAIGIVWDTSLNEAQALAWVEETFGGKPGFSKREDATGDWINRP